MSVLGFIFVWMEIKMEIGFIILRSQPTVLDFEGVSSGVYNLMLKGLFQVYRFFLMFESFLDD